MLLSTGVLIALATIDSTVAEPEPLAPARELELGLRASAVEAACGGAESRTLRERAVESTGETSGLARLEGRVLWSDGLTPLAGAGVRIRSRLAGRATRSTATFTDACGRYALAFAAPASLDELSVHLQDGSLALRKSLRESIDAAEVRRRELFVPRGGRVQGLVVDASGRGLAGIRVDAWQAGSLERLLEPAEPPHASAITDPDGRFSFGALGPCFGLSVRDPARRSERIFGSVRELERVEELRLVSVEAEVQRARVLDPARRPIAGARARSVPTLSSRELEPAESPGIYTVRAEPIVAWTDLDGRIELALGCDEEIELEITAAGFLPWRGRFPLGEGSKEVVLEEGCGLSGVVLDAGGRPVAGARVRVAAHELCETWSDAAGRFELEALPKTASGSLYAVARGRGQAWIEELSIPGPSSPPLEVRLEAPAPCAGRVVDEHGRGVGGLELEIEGPVASEGCAPRSAASPRCWSVPENRARTDESGAFRFDHLSRGRYVVRIEQPGGGLGALRVVATVPSRDLLVRWMSAPARFATIRGLVLDGRTGARIHCFSVTPLRSSGDFTAGSPREFTAPTGEFELDVPADEPVALAIRAGGYAVDLEVARARAVGTHFVHAQLFPARIGKLRIVDRRGDPISGAIIALVDGEGRAVAASDAIGGALLALRTDERGESAAIRFSNAAKDVEIALPDGGASLRCELPLRSDDSGFLELAVDVNGVQGGLGAARVR